MYILWIWISAMLRRSCTNISIHILILICYIRYIYRILDANHSILFSKCLRWCVLILECLKKNIREKKKVLRFGIRNLRSSPKNFRKQKKNTTQIQTFIFCWKILCGNFWGVNNLPMFLSETTNNSPVVCLKHGIFGWFMKRKKDGSFVLKFPGRHGGWIIKNYHVHW